MAACPRLTELTIIYPHPYGAPAVAETARSVISELVDACKALPDFDTFQILRLLVDTPPRRYAARSTEQWKRTLSEEVGGVKDWAVCCLKAKTGCEEGGGRKRTTLRVIGLNSSLRPGEDIFRRFHLGSVKVEVYEA